MNERDDVINRIKNKVPAFMKDVKQSMKKVKPANKEPVILIELINDDSLNEQEAIKNALLLSLKMLKKDLLKYIHLN